MKIPIIYSTKKQWGVVKATKDFAEMCDENNIYFCNSKYEKLKKYSSTSYTYVYYLVYAPNFSRVNIYGDIDLFKERPIKWTSIPLYILNMSTTYEKFTDIVDIDKEWTFE